LLVGLLARWIGAPHVKGIMPIPIVKVSIVQPNTVRNQNAATAQKASAFLPSNHQLQI